MRERERERETERERLILFLKGRFMSRCRRNSETRQKLRKESEDLLK